MFNLNTKYFKYHASLNSPFIQGLNESFFTKYESISGKRISGHSCGKENNQIKAFGEFVERMIFSTNSPFRKNLKLKQTLLLQNKTWNKWIQTQTTEDLNSINENEYPCLKIFNIFTNEMAYIPCALINFENVDCFERKLIPFIDTSSNAAHTLFYKSFENSLLEFIERQSMLLNWYDDKNEGDSYCIDRSCLEYIGIPLEIRHLLNTGKIYIGDISMYFDVYTFLCVYVSDNDPYKVFFAISASSGFNYIETILASLFELYGTYLFMKNSLKEKDFLLHDILKQNLLKKNCSKTMNEFSCFRGIPQKFDLDMIKRKNKRFSTKKILKNIEKISKDVFLYVRPYKISEFMFWGTRIMSPDFFLHINTSMPGHLNKCCEYYGINNFKKGMMPFP